MEELLVTPNAQIIIRLILALIFGAFVGIEREYVGKAAGLRTFGLVSLGACLFTTISLFGVDRIILPDPGVVSEGFRYNYDPTRIISNIVVGIGFIGAGLIIFRGFRIEGLTTSSGLWVAAAIGVAVGFGFYLVAAVASLLTLFVLYFLRRVEGDIHDVHKHEDTL